MSEQNGFGSGFILGSVVGGVVGGLLGTVLASRNERQILKVDEINRDRPKRYVKRNRDFSSEDMELARHGLEDKIAQLNLAIDDVREQLGRVEANSEE